jgi:DNA-directed RNA polymerase specialized sigma24 family protein
MSLPNQNFRTTRWSVVRRASAADSDTTSVTALAEFCDNYRGPLLAFTRMSVARHQDAEDLLHGFFEKLLERNFLAMADPDRGRLRTFLLTCLKRHIADEYRRETAAKRGGGLAHVPLDEALSMTADTPDPTRFIIASGPW